MSSGAPRFPDAALEWLVGERTDRHVLTLGPGAGLPRKLARRGQHVWCIVDDDHDLNPRPDLPELQYVVARPESLPFEPCQFDVVLAHQILHKLAPGLVLGEFARVLKPGGWVGASYLVRDDSVPWVRRLVAVMRTVDPNAMSADVGASAIQTLISSKYFPRHEQRDFRIWVPVTRQELIAMAASQPRVAALPELGRDRLLTAVGAIYDGASAGSELRLPYQLSCYRAYVDHDELTTPIVLSDDALIIPP
ncbi:class I SAM-dependent methyltransferase [Propionibacterium freudenreichii]|uniref:Conserved domain protein n=1 Tax=Propionibacterium freudenreichii TaxID=1744 RepID=A0A2C7AUH5_9ACTN